MPSRAKSRSAQRERFRPVPPANPVATGPKPGRLLLEPRPPLMPGERRKRHGEPVVHKPGQAREGMVADAPVPLPGVGEAHPDHRDAPPAQVTGRVQDQGLFQRGGPQGRPGAHHARSHRDDHGVGPGGHFGRRQGRMDGHRLQIAAEGVARGDDRVHQTAFPKARQNVRDGRRERRPVGHDVGHPRPGARGFDGGRHHRQLAVKAAGRDRKPRQVRNDGKGVVIRALFLLDGEDPHLRGRVPHLHDVARTLQVRSAAPDGGDEVVAAGSQSQGDGGGIERHPVARFDRSRQGGIADGPLPPPLNFDPGQGRALSPLDDLDDNPLAHLGARSPRHGPPPRPAPARACRL